MSDARLREPERRCKETGAVADEASLLRERARTGQLAEAHLVLGAYGAEMVVNTARACLAWLPTGWRGDAALASAIESLVPWLLGYGEPAGSGSQPRTST